MQWTAIRGILRSTDRPPRPQRELSSLQAVDFFLQLPTVGLIRLATRFGRNLSTAAGRRLGPSFFVRVGWCCLIDVGSSHVDSVT